MQEVIIRATMGYALHVDIVTSMNEWLNFHMKIATYKKAGSVKSLQHMHKMAAYERPRDIITGMLSIDGLVHCKHPYLH